MKFLESKFSLPHVLTCRRLYSRSSFSQRPFPADVAFPPALGEALGTSATTGFSEADIQKLDGIGQFITDHPQTSSTIINEKKCYMWHMTCDTWHMTHDMWHMTCDTWHVTHDMWHVVGGKHSLKILVPYLLRFWQESDLKIWRKIWRKRMSEWISQLQGCL